MIVPMFDPVKNLIAIDITNDKADQRYCHENRECVVFLIPDGGALHRQKISSGDTADYRDQEKRGYAHAAQPEHVAKIILGKTGKKKQHEADNHAGFGGQEIEFL